MTNTNFRRAKIVTMAASFFTSILMVCMPSHAGAQHNLGGVTEMFSASTENIVGMQKAGIGWGDRSYANARLIRHSVDFRDSGVTVQDGFFRYGDVGFEGKRESRPSGQFAMRAPDADALLLAYDRHSVDFRDSSVTVQDGFFRYGDVGFEGKRESRPSGQFAMRAPDADELLLAYDPWSLKNK